MSELIRRLDRIDAAMKPQTCTVEQILDKRTNTCCMCVYPAQVSFGGSDYCDLHSPCGCATCATNRADELRYRERIPECP